MSRLLNGGRSSQTAGEARVLLALGSGLEPNARPIILQPDGDLTINYLDT